MCVYTQTHTHTDYGEPIKLGLNAVLLLVQSKAPRAVPAAISHCVGLYEAPDLFCPLNSPVVPK